MSEPPETERSDIVPGDAAVTAWRQAARRHQSLWRERHGWPAGAQAIPDKAGGGDRLIGSRVEIAFARAHATNFLSDTARDAAQYRVARREPHQTLDETRLFADLLSSMPMCFNLFGPLWADRDLAVAAAHRWFPELCPVEADVEVRFEWSPGRLDERWLGDKTAFDVALLIHTDDGTNLVGIETKYHEYPAVEPVVTRRRDGTTRTREPKRRYKDVTNEAQLFPTTSWLDRVWGTKVEQIWRDHMLALAWAHAISPPARCLYVLAAPAENPAWRPLVAEYCSMLTSPAAATIEYRSVDGLIDSAADLLPHAEVFRQRYLAVDVQREP